MLEKLEIYSTKTNKVWDKVGETIIPTTHLEMVYIYYQNRDWGMVCKCANGIVLPKP